MTSRKKSPGKKRPGLILADKQVLVVLPTYNEIDNLEKVATEVRSLGYQVLVIDDNSPDGTGKLADRLSQSDKGIKVIHRPGKMGLGTAYIAGFTYGMEQGFDYLVEMDCDGSHHTEYLPALVAAAKRSGGLAIGSRYVAKGGVRGWPMHRRLLSWGANFYCRLVLGLPVHDSTAGFRCYSTKALQTVGLDGIHSSGYSFQVEMVWRMKRAGLAIQEVPIIFTDRTSGQSKVSEGEILNSFLSVLKLRIKSGELSVFWTNYRLPIFLALVLSVSTSLPYIYSSLSQEPGRVFMGFFINADDASTYLAKMHQGWEGSWLWTNRYSTESSAGAYFFTYWIALGHLASLFHLSLLLTYHLARILGIFFLLCAARVFMRHFLPNLQGIQRFALYFLALGMGLGFIMNLLNHPVLFGVRTNGLDIAMPELTAFNSMLTFPHFVWAVAFQALGIVFTFRAVSRSSWGWAVAAGLMWLGEASIHAQMIALMGGAFVAVWLFRPSMRSLIMLALAFIIPGPYVLYSYWGSSHIQSVILWSSEWRNNFAPDVPSLIVTLLPQILLAIWAIPKMVRRRSPEDVFILAWFLLLGVILWVHTPADNLRRRFFDGLYLPLVVMAAMGLYEVILVRLQKYHEKISTSSSTSLGVRSTGFFVRRLAFSYVSVSSVTAWFLVLGLILFTRGDMYSVTIDEWKAIQFLSTQSPGVVLSSEHLGLYIPAYTSDTVYVGQYSETYNAPQKAALADNILKGQRSLSVLTLTQRVDYVLWSRDSSPSPPPDLGRPIFTTPGAIVFKVY